MRPRISWTVALAFAIPVALAWIQFCVRGLPAMAAVPHGELASAPGFPGWIRVCHAANFLLMALIIRSGLSILMDHPRLYRSVDCTMNSEWARFTPTRVPLDRLYIANDDQRYLSPLIGMPGYRHTVGMARHWHFLCNALWIGFGLSYVVALFMSGHWPRVIPTAWSVVPMAWDGFVYYATFHLPPEPNGFYAYNALQQIAYATVIFVLAPLSVLTGLAMSPAIDNRFSWYPKLFGGRQGARSLHFMVLVGYLAFLAVHVALVCVTGFAHGMNHIVLGRDSTSRLGLLLGVLGIAGVVCVCAAAQWAAWNCSRQVQQLALATVGALEHSMANRIVPRAEYRQKDISPKQWPNGLVPTSAEWVALAQSEFDNYRLRVHGLVEHPVELSLVELRDLSRRDQITLHHCIQGWSGISHWGGLPIAALIELVKPQSRATTLVFRSYGETANGTEYYDTQSIADASHPQSILAYDMNYEPLTAAYGAPLRLRVENQLGYKMVKWIREIEFVESVKSVGKGYGGIKEDEEFFDLLPNI